MAKTYIVSNRLPFTLVEEDGNHRLSRSSGGLVSALLPVHQSSDSWWVGYFGNPYEVAQAGDLMERERLLSIDVPKELYSAYYNGAANAGVWPLFHYFPAISVFDSREWQAYRAVNQAFADALAPRLEDDDTVWVHDYHLMLLPGMLRERRPRLRIGYFHHIPFPASEVFRIHPECMDILRGLLAADVVGFHTMEYARHFISVAVRLLGTENVADDVTFGDRLCKVGAFPLGIDIDTFSRAGSGPEFDEAFAQIHKHFEGRILILGIDRLDYTKGIRERLLAFEDFLKRYPAYRGRAVLFQLCVPTRIEVPQYSNLRAEVERLVGRINGEFSTHDYVPVQYLFQSKPASEVMALYRRADVCMVTPVRDGLNLVCKEYVYARSDLKGMLILSEFAGAAEEMGEALLVNPVKLEQVADAIVEAIEMPDTERRERMGALRQRVVEHHNVQWASTFLEMVSDASERNRANESRDLDEDEIAEILTRVRLSRKTLLAVDVDAVLDITEFERARETRRSRVRQLLAKASAHPRFETLLVTSRPRSECEPLRARYRCWMAAEYGADFAEPGTGPWSEIELPESLTPFLPEILRILERCVKRVPRSHLRSQRTTVSWRYAPRASPFAHNLALQTAHLLNEILSRSSFHCVLGRNGLEVRPLPINGGTAIEQVCRRLELDPGDTIISLGDDHSDEGFYRSHAESNISIAVGAPMSASKLLVRDYDEFHSFLERLISVE